MRLKRTAHSALSVAALVGSSQAIGAAPANAGSDDEVTLRAMAPPAPGFTR